MSDLDQNTIPTGEAQVEQSKRIPRCWRSAESPQVGKTFRIYCNIGDPAIVDMKMIVPQIELDPDVETLRTLIVLSTRDCEVEPGWEELKFPKVGESEIVVFSVTPQKVGEHKMRIMVFLHKQMVMLQELIGTFTVTE